MQSVEFDPENASPWVKEHVFTSLTVCPHVSGNIRGLYAHEEGQCTFEEPAKVYTERLYVKPTGEAYVIGTHADCPWRTREQIKREVLAFMDIKQYGKPELWGWCASYDHVAFCQLFGTMMDVPKGFPHSIHDLQNRLDKLGIADEELPIQEDTHHALADARYIKKVWEMLTEEQS